MRWNIYTWTFYCSGEAVVQWVSYMATVYTYLSFQAGGLWRVLRRPRTARDYWLMLFLCLNFYLSILSNTLPNLFIPDVFFPALL